MSPDELHARYVAEIENRGRDDKYIDGVEERELMQIAIQHGFSAERARSLLVDVCRERGYVIEATVVQLIRDQLATTGRTDRRINRSAFDAVVNQAVGEVRGTTRTRNDVLKLVVAAMDDGGFTRAKTWWGRDWYSRLKRDLGIA